jgi:hypothetical protein
MALFPTVVLVGLADESFLAAALAPVEERRLRQKAGNFPGEGNVAMMAVLSDESSSSQVQLPLICESQSTCLRKAICVTR